MSDHKPKIYFRMALEEPCYGEWVSWDEMTEQEKRAYAKSSNSSAPGGFSAEEEESMAKTETTTETDYERGLTIHEKAAKLAAEVDEQFTFDGFEAATVNVECNDRIHQDGSRRLSIVIYVEHLGGYIR